MASRNWNWRCVATAGFLAALSCSAAWADMSADFGRSSNHGFSWSLIDWPFALSLALAAAGLAILAMGVSELAMSRAPKACRCGGPGSWALRVAALGAAIVLAPAMALMALMVFYILTFTVSLAFVTPLDNVASLDAMGGVLGICALSMGLSCACLGAGMLWTRRSLRLAKAEMPTVQDWRRFALFTLATTLLFSLGCAAIFLAQSKIYFFIQRNSWWFH